MKTRLLCLIIGLITIVSMLASCSQGGTNLNEEVVDNVVRVTDTVVMFMMSETEVPEKTEHDIEEALNKLTKSKFKTQIDLRFYTEDVYYEKLEATIKAKETEILKAEREELQKRRREKEIRESCKQAGIPYVPETTKAPSTVITEEETLVNEEYGIIEYKYPDAKDNQVDIFYLGGYDKYQEYIDNEWLARLNDEVNTSSKKLKEHIPAVYMDNITSAGIYGIPTNALIGEYTWMLLNKQIMEDHFFTSADISASLTDTDLYNFLNDVYTYERDENGDLTVLPVKGTIEPTNMFYWNYDDEAETICNTPSLLGVYCPTNAKIGTNLSIYHVFNDPNYVSQLKFITTLKNEGILVDEAEQDTDLPFAMSIVKGSYDLYHQYEDEYYVKMLEAPRADNNNLYTNMFCVNELESNTARSMEIVTYLNTNPEARNILQYGIEGENYYIDDNDVLHRYNDSYMMDVNKTGNIFMAHPEEELPGDYWNVGIEHNESVGITPIFGFVIDEDSELDVENLKAVLALEAHYMAELDKCKTVDEFNEFIKNVKKEIAENPAYIKVVSPRFPEDGELSSLNYLYYNWLDQNGFLPK